MSEIKILMHKLDGAEWVPMTVEDFSGVNISDYSDVSALSGYPSAFPPVIGSGATEAVAGNDSRLTDARTPTAHTHDDRYYTESEVDALLAEISGILPLDAPPENGYLAAATNATGTVDFSGLPSDGDTLTINGTVLTFRTTAGTSGDVQIGADQASTITSLSETANVLTEDIVTSPHPTLLGIAAETAGAAGNSIALSKSGSVMTLSGSTLSGGADPTPTGGTAATQLGQTAIVTTTHDGDPYGVDTTYIDRWVCVGLAPYTWQPCDNLSVSPNGTVHRTIPDNSGIPSTYIAYP